MDLCASTLIVLSRFAGMAVPVGKPLATPAKGILLYH